MPTTQRWFAVGSAGESEPEAGRRAVDEALVYDDAKLLVAFCSPSYDLPALAGQIKSRAGDVPVIGCTTAGEIASSGPPGPSVVVAALGGEGFAIETAVATGASKDLRAAGSHVARCLPTPDDRPHRALLVLTDGLTGDQQEILRGVYGALGAGVPFVGGCAGDDLKMTRTFQLYGDQVLTDSVVAAGIASNAPLGIGVRHGWERVGSALLVTRSEGRRVYSLDDRPALDVYLEQSGAGDGVGIDEEEFIPFAMAHPLGLSRHSGEEQARGVVGADFVDRSLLCVAEVPQGGLVWIMAGAAASVLRATDAACADSLAALEGQPPLGMIAFDCIGRRGVLGDDGIQAEIGRLVVQGGGAPVAGFYTYGEIARTRGMRGLHNQTLVVLSIA